MSGCMPWVLGLSLLGQIAAPTPPPPAPATRSLSIKYVRDSEEYWTLMRQVYRQAADAVERAAKPAPPAYWAVVLDVDETALDNSVYELEREAFDLPFAAPSWRSWVRRVQAPAVPGVREFIAAVRGIPGGRVVWITDREASPDPQADLTGATRANLEKEGLWGGDDLLCMKDGAVTKRQRRQQLVSGNGACSWPGKKTEIVVFVGDQISDFPDEDEPGYKTDERFGRRFFILPQPMYGRWVNNVTRPAPTPVKGEK